MPPQKNRMVVSKSLVYNMICNIRAGHRPARGLDNVLMQRGIWDAS